MRVSREDHLYCVRAINIRPAILENCTSRVYCTYIWDDYMDLKQQISALLEKIEATNNDSNIAKQLAELKELIQQLESGKASEPLWRKIFGPGRRELELSQQRQALIERCERAEASAFDALAETAEVGRERDDALAKLKSLEAEKSA